MKTYKELEYQIWKEKLEKDWFAKTEVSLNLPNSFEIFESKFTNEKELKYKEFINKISENLKN